MPVGGVCCTFISLTARNRVTLPSPAGDHEGHPIGINLRKGKPENTTPEVID